MAPKQQISRGVSRKLRPPSPAVQGLLQQALASHQTGVWHHAEALYRQALMLDPHCFDALNMLGALLGDQGLHAEGLEYVDQALKVYPLSARAHLNRGAMLRKLGKQDDALRSYEKAIALQPDLPEAPFNLANLLDEMQRPQDALRAYERALKLRPGFYDAVFQQGVVLTCSGRHEEAIEFFRKAATLAPQSPDPLFGEGVALCALMRIEEAVAIYTRALALKPDFQEVRSNAAHLKLLLGDFTNGWTEYETRHERVTLREFSAPRWFGDFDLAGKTILLHCEQGLGDTLQFCRYALEVRKLGARVLLEVQPPLVTLMKSLSDDITVLPKGAEHMDFDCQCPILSLPLAFKTDLTSIPQRGKYLSADPQKVDHWREILGTKTKPLRVGLVWSGNPLFPGDADRSMRFRDVINVDEGLVEFVSLQKEMRERDRDDFAKQTRVRFFGDQLLDFSDTAALAENMDLIVTSDTSLAHLAGALGKPTWVIVPKIPDWRWMMSREDCPWYDSVRLFRQSLRESDWVGVTSRVRSQLRSLVQA
ncbi:MAG: tetratricopeptide repeat-containing glycosyltransferase family protein [Rhodocyclaceae bacterium]